MPHNAYYSHDDDNGHDDDDMPLYEVTDDDYCSYEESERYPYLSRGSDGRWRQRDAGHAINLTVAMLDAMGTATAGD